jgi:hypothetical protein
MPMHGQLLKCATQQAPGSYPEAGIKIKKPAAPAANRRTAG